MERIALAREVLAEIVEGRAAQARRGALVGDGSVGASLAAVAAFWAGDFDEADRCGAAAVRSADLGGDAGERALAAAAVALAASGGPGIPSGDSVGRAIEAFQSWGDPGDDEDPGTAEFRALVVYLITEAGLVSARLRDAATFADRSGIQPAQAWAGHPIAAMMTACAVRLAAFRGHIDEAVRLADAMRDAAEGGPLEVVARAVDCFVLGNADSADAMELRAQIDGVIPAQPVGWVERGALLLVAFGAIAIGDVSAAAAFVFRAGGDGGLTGCTLIDRALGLELLLVAALEGEDLDAAAVWAGRLAEIADHPITAPTVDRALARLALAQGAVTEAVERLDRSIIACRRDERLVEAAESEIVLARARIATRDVAGAARGLRTLVAAADNHGHAAVRRSASAALGTARRRLPPLAGGGWSVLSDRETEVAHRILAGERTEQIAAALFLSTHTIRVHTSRVLCAFGVPTRVGLLAAAGVEVDTSEPGGAPDRAMLSPRQAEVVQMIAAGRSNGEIAGELGISIKAVEKHVGDALVRWQATSRFDLARSWLVSASELPARRR